MHCSTLAEEAIHAAIENYKTGLGETGAQAMGCPGCCNKCADIYRIAD
jgi:bacterioferritin-associated ferredoxin